MSREQEIIKYFEDIARKNGMKLNLVSAESMKECADVDINTALRLFTPFGWMPPVAIDGLFVFTFCPSMIAEQTKGLDDEDLTNYLRTIHWLANMHVIHYQIPFEERTIMIDDLLQSKFNGNLSILSKVQMSALDL